MELADNDLLDLLSRPPEADRESRQARGSSGARGRQGAGGRGPIPVCLPPLLRGPRHDPVRRQSHSVLLGRQPEHGAADLQGHDRPGRDRHPQALRRRPASSPTTRASCRPRPATRPSPTSTATRASCCTAATRSRSSRPSATTSRPATCCSTASCRAATEKDDFTHLVTHHTMVNEQMQFFLRGFRRDAHPMAIMTGLVGALSAFYHDSTDINNAEHRGDLGHPPDRQDADAGGDGLQVHDRPALHLSEERPLLRRQLHAHDVRHAVRGLQRRTRCWCARWTASSSCTPTTSRTPRPRRCACAARRAPTRSRRSLPASPASGVRPTAAPTRRR